jgi:hypothetical protein
MRELGFWYFMKIPMPKNRTFFLLPCLFLFLLGVLASSVLAEPSGLLRPDNFSYAVRIGLPLHEKAVLGNGFYYRNKESTYIVTARHVLFAPTQVVIKDGATFPIPRQLIHRIRYDKTNRILSLEGVLSSKEKDEILMHSSTNESGRRAVEYLYEKSQRLKLKAHIATVVTYAPGSGELELGLTRMMIKGLVKYHPVQDVAVIKIGGSTTCEAHNCIDFVPEVQVRKSENLTALDATDVRLMHDVVMGSQVVVLGFTSSATDGLSLERKQPLLRKGKVAATNKELGIIALDCAVYPGDSGGLVLEIVEGSDERHFKGIGVMSGLLHYEKDKQDSKNYSLATALDAVIELLNQ